jgi:hypothetical protein
MKRLEGNSSRSWVENTNMTDCTYHQSINSDKRLPQSPFIGQYFLDENILLLCLIVN